MNPVSMSAPPRGEPSHIYDTRLPNAQLDALNARATKPLSIDLGGRAALCYTLPMLSPSSSGLGRRPFKAKIAGSNPAGGTICKKYEPVRP